MKAKTLAIPLVFSMGMLLALASCAQQPSAVSGSAAPDQEQNMSMMMENIQDGMNWFGGPIYNGEPALKATAALVRAGGSADDFSFAQALVAMLGQDMVNAEIAKLKRQYGEDDVQLFINGMDYAINTGLQLAAQAGITLPDAPADLRGTKLAKALVKAGTAPDGTFWAGRLFDVAISHKLHNAVMANIEANLGHYPDKITHKILNQAMYDVAQALGMNEVKLAPFH